MPRHVTTMTLDQLVTERQYYAEQVLARSSSADRRERAERAIERIDAELEQRAKER